MRQGRAWLGIIVFVASCAVPALALAQSTPTDAAIAELRSLIADQRAALERQARIIEEQGRTLSALQQQVEAASPRTEARTASALQLTAAASAAAPAPVGAQVPPSQPVTRTAAQRAPDLPASVVSPGDFPGSIGIPGTESAFKLGGQARMVAVHTLGPLGTDDRFVTSSIPVGVPRAGDDARTVYSPAASRLSTEIRTPSLRGSMRTFIESDFGGANLSMRLRHAYLQTDRFLVGQTWSTFSDPEAEPIGIDFEGLNAISLFRQPEFRWTPYIRKRYQLAVAIENPAPDLTGAQGISLTPDFIMRLRWEPDSKREFLTRTAHVQASVILRQLRGQTTTDPDVTLTTGGIGGNLSGVLIPRWDADDRIKFAVYGGSGIGRYIGDLRSLGGQDAVYDTTHGGLRALDVSSGYIGYERAWTRVFTTAVTYGVVNVSNLDIQPDDALHRTLRGTVNLTWNPIPQADIVLEFLGGRRVNKNGQSGFSSQVQAGWTVKF